MAAIVDAIPFAYQNPVSQEQKTGLGIYRTVKPGLRRKPKKAGRQELKSLQQPDTRESLAAYADHSIIDNQLKIKTVFINFFNQ